MDQEKLKEGATPRRSVTFANRCPNRARCRAVAEAEPRLGQPRAELAKQTNQANLEVQQAYA
jgi:hypothetical protein